MPVIKRYPNRKLYDTEKKQYIALEQVADLIRQGQEVQVVDNVSGEDLTAIILTQIILEQERKQAGWVPSGILADLLRARSQTLHALRQALAGPQEWQQNVDSEIEARIQDLLERGELSEEETIRWREKLLPGAPVDEKLIGKLLVERGLPTRKELRQVSAQLEALAAVLEEIAAGQERNATLALSGQSNLSSRDASNE